MLDRFFVYYYFFFFCCCDIWNVLLFLGILGINEVFFVNGVWFWLVAVVSVAAVAAAVDAFVLVLDLVLDLVFISKLEGTRLV